MRVGVLGPVGSFSHVAALRAVHADEFVLFDSFSSVFEGVSKGEVEVGVVPMENSLEGAVGETLDCLLSADVYIVHELVLEIRHNLLSLSPSTERIERVLSHPQALAQCRSFLKKLKGVEQVATSSTSEAARLATLDVCTAAIASYEAATQYGLNVLMENIQDMESHTRFVSISKEPLKAVRAPSKTSIAILLKKDRPGALYEILSEFATRGINLTRIESRTRRRMLGEYYFFIDLEGALGEDRIDGALCSIGERVDVLHILGSYPAFKLDSKQQVP